MSEPTGAGMGRPSGPAFHGPPVTGMTPAGSAIPPASGPEPTITPPVPSGPPPSRLPTVLTWLAVVAVALVVAVASVLAARDDVRQATPRPEPPSVSSSGPAAQDRIEFATSTGSGVLEIADHGWDSDGSDTDAPGSLLTVAVRITCASGTVGYGPSSFQAFDRSGDLFDPVVLADSSTALDSGILSAGQQVTGTVAFDIPHGGVTLLMSDESSRTVTALRVPD